MTKKGILICYELNHLNPNQVNKFCRDLYGYTSKSKFGKYTYKKEGLLSKIPHISPNKSILIITKKNKHKVLNFLKKHEAKIFVRDITLTKTDSKALKE